MGCEVRWALGHRAWRSDFIEIDGGVLKKSWGKRGKVEARWTLKRRNRRGRAVGRGSTGIRQGSGLGLLVTDQDLL